MASALSALWPAQLRPALSRTLARVLDLAFPPACPACTAATAEVGNLCPVCWARVRFIERPYCERLGTPFAQDLGAGLLSPEAMADPPVFRRARAVARYEDGPVRQLVHRLKYGDRLELARPMAHWMARAGHELIAEAELLVPVPLHRRRLLARRFNQSALLAAAISRETGVPADPRALERRKHTPPQVGLTRLQRAKNLQGALHVPEARRLAVEGRRILLVDDVMTSGATTNAAARALLRGGAESVDVLVFARVVTEP